MDGVVNTVQSALRILLEAVTIVCAMFTVNTVQAQAPVRNPVSMPNELQLRQVTKAMLDAKCIYGTSVDTLEVCVQVLAAQLPPLDNRKREEFGEFYDPEGYLNCRRALLRKGLKASSSCEFRALRRVENPEYWPYPDVPPIKWPEAPKPETYKTGMTSEEYFKALCEREAGEFIYKTVENVEGVYQIRPRVEETDYAMQDRYVVEDPYGYVTTGSVRKPQDVYVQPYFGEYSYLEVPASESGKAVANVTRYFRSASSTSDQLFPSARNRRPAYVPYLVAQEITRKVSSRYGFVWRGISRPMDRILGIAGGELAIVDMKTGEILAFRRGFAISGRAGNGSGRIWWMKASICDNASPSPGRAANWKPEHWFVYDVLKPREDINEGIENVRHH